MNKNKIPLQTKNKFYLICLSVIVLSPVYLFSALAEDTKKLNLEEVNEALSLSEHSLTKGKQTATELDDQLGQISRDLSIFQQKLTRITEKIELTKVSLNRLKNELKVLKRQRKDTQLELAYTKKKLGEVIGALQRVSYMPTDLVVIMPMSAKNVSHTKLLLSSITESLKTRTIRFMETIAQLKNMEQNGSERESSIKLRIKNLKTQHTDLRIQLSQKVALKRKTTILHEHTANSIKQLVTNTKSLQELLAQLIENVEKNNANQRHTDISLESESATHKNSKLSYISTNYKMASLRNMRMPIQGKVVSYFNEATEYGFLTKGIIIRTKFGEEIIAPSGGRVVFSGPFHEYGMLLIIDHGAGYHTVLAGIDHVYKLSDKYVLPGEPVGVMNSPNEKQPELYMELRRRGHPINPLPWLATNINKDKVSGG